MNRRNTTLIALCAVAVGSVSGCAGNSIAASTTTTPSTTVVPVTAPPVDCQVMFGAGNVVPGGQPTCLINGQLTSVVAGTYTCSNAKTVNYNDFAIWLDDGIVAAKPAAGGVTQTQLEAACGVAPPTTTVAPTTTVPPTTVATTTVPPTPPPTTPPPPPTTSATTVTNAPDPNRPSPVPGASADMATWMNQIIDGGFCVDSWVTARDALGYDIPGTSEMYVCESHFMTLIRFDDDATLRAFVQSWLDLSADNGVDLEGASLLKLGPATVMFPIADNSALSIVTVIVAQGLIGGEEILLTDIVA